MISPQDLVHREVHYCVSSLVATLAPHWGALDLTHDTTGLADLFEQAGHLATPIDDYEEAATQAGLTVEADADGYHVVDAPEDSDMRVTTYENPEQAGIAYCDFHGIEPYQREVFEHWIVSDWLADKLEAEGEKVKRDLAGLTVWARTTTGQAIYADDVIERICAALNAGA